MKFIAKHFRTIQILFDIALLTIAWSIAFTIRFEFLPLAQVHPQIGPWLIPLVLVSLYYFLKNEQYDRDHLLTITEEVMRLFRANALSVVTFILILYFCSETRVSRIMLLLYAGISTSLLFFGRVVMRSWLSALREKGFLLRRVFIAGDGAQVETYIDRVAGEHRMGLKITALFGCKTSSLADVPRHDLAALEPLLKKERPDIVVFGFDGEQPDWVSSFIQRHYDDLIRLQILSAGHHALIGLNAEMIEGVHILTLNEPTFSIPEITAKRAIDLFGSFFGLIFLSPFLAIIMLLVKLSSPGPVFFGQERIGMAGRKFKMWKFRSMRVGSADQSNGWTVQNDPRRTRIGTFLRRTSLDELPQLWNVLMGDMSLVGPRAEQVRFVEKFRGEIPAYMLRHKMKAGITGWAQVNGWRGDTSLHKRIEYDLYYIRHWTIWFDLKILLLTFFRGFINKNAY